MKVENLTRKTLVDAIAKLDPIYRQKVTNDELTEEKAKRIREVTSIFIETLIDSIIEIVEGKDIETFLQDIEDDELDQLLELEPFDDAA